MCVCERERDCIGWKKKKAQDPLVDYLQERINNCSMLLEIMDQLC